MGGAGRLFASGVAIPIESLAFKGIENAVASAKMDTEKVWDGFKADTLAMSALFFSMRLTHGAVGKIAAKIGTGKWLPGLSRPLQAKMFMTQPTGRIILPIATRELNGAGKAFLGLMNHGGGVAAMYGAGLFNRQVDLQEGSKQGELGNIFDTLITYPQAMVGFKIADGLTSGKLHSFLGNFRGRIEDLKREIKDTKSILKPVPVAKNPLLAATLASPVDSPIDSSSRATAPSPQPQAASSTSAAKPKSVEADLEDIEIEVDDAAFNVRSAVHSAAFSPVQFHLDLSGNHMVIDSGRDLQMIWIGRYPSEKTVRAIRMHANATVHVGMDETVSNYHAIIARDSAGAWWIGDQGSAYGTTLNNQRVLPGKPIPLESVNHIRLGPSLTFLLEIQGDLVPVDTTVKPPNIPIPNQQFDKVKPPAPAEKFPFEVVFPGDITPKGTVEVAYLVSLDGKEKEPFKSNRSNWGFSYENKPVGLIYIDETGKWVALNQAEENGI
jgi:hypothetical protein